MRTTFETFFYETTEATRKYLPDRIPQDAHTVYSGQEGELLKAATDIAEGSHRSIPSNSPEFTEIEDPVKQKIEHRKLTNIIKPREEQALADWAEQNNLILDNKEFDRKWKASDRMGGAEHAGYFDEEAQRWFKRNNLNYHSTYLEYFHRLALHNKLFPEAPLVLKGFVWHDNQLLPVITQLHVRANRGATEQEVDALMKTLGYVKTPNTDNDYYNPNSGILVQDLHDENVLVDSEGHLHVVDPVIYLDKHGKRNRLQKWDELTNLK